MSTQTIRFQPVRARAFRVGKCPNCGKTVRRTRTFENTVNPFNRNQDGSIKTLDEVRADVQRQAHDWDADFTHCVVTA